jgi:hypothetical protein
MSSLGAQCRHDATAVMIPKPFSLSNEEIRCCIQIHACNRKLNRFIGVVSPREISVCLYQIFMTSRMGRTGTVGAGFGDYV